MRPLIELNPDDIRYAKDGAVHLTGWVVAPDPLTGIIGETFREFRDIPQPKVWACDDTDLLPHVQALFPTADVRWRVTPKAAPDDA
jgi:hypothetical protein